MGGGGGSDPVAEARRAEEDRQNRIKMATEAINATFAGKKGIQKTREIPDPANPGHYVTTGNGDNTEQTWVPGGTKHETYYEWIDDPTSVKRDAMYRQQHDVVYELNRREVERQAAEAERVNRFGLARNGLLGGSVNVDSASDLNRRTNEGLMRAGGIASQAAADLKTQDERTRSNLISLAQSGIDTGTAAQQALYGLDVNSANAASARAGSTVGSLFNDLSQAYLYNQQNQGRQSGSNGGQYGGQWFGVSSPNQRYGGQ